MRLVTRELCVDDAEALALVAAAGVHGAYVHNSLVDGEGAGFVLAAAGRTAALAWHGPRGNLIVVAEPAAAEFAATRLVDEVAQRQWSWRIAMGPEPALARLHDRLAKPPLCWRDQVYYRGERATAASPRPVVEVRRAQRADRDRLAQATLALNHGDLNVDPARVDRRWLRDSVDERIAKGDTLVIGPPGAFWCKLDHGSRGPGGVVIEGVFTFPEHRGQGLASALVAASIAECGEPSILHVSRHNLPARAAYEAAGMVEAGACKLLLTS
ncbi:MAG: GNAT family N-acetyltransferase [Planctomycetes bacterium]|nr:GNAT family N-acetyltransferase [Planctomycetota bacterium]